MFSDSNSEVRERLSWSKINSIRMLIGDGILPQELLDNIESLERYSALTESEIAAMEAAIGVQVCIGVHVTM